LELQIDTPPRGWRLPRRAKGSALAESLQQALEHLTQTGEYRAIATKWGWRRA
jgi:ABC-type amino acid transport substrate-binding protein